MANKGEMAKAPNLRLKQARRKFFGAAREAAAALGIPQSTYYGYENGSRSFDPDVATLLARRFKVSPEYLLYGRYSPEKGDATGNKSRTISLFLTVDLVYFSQIRSGASPVSLKTMPVLEPSLPLRLYCVHQNDRSMVIGGNDGLIARYPAIAQDAVVFLDPDAVFGPDEIVHAVIPRLQISVIRLLTRFRGGDGVVHNKLVAFNHAFEDIVLDAVGGVYILGKYLGQLQLEGLRVHA